MKKLLSLVLLLSLILTMVPGCAGYDLGDIEGIIGGITDVGSSQTDKGPSAAALDDVPEFAGYPYAVINDNQPFFTDEEITTDAYEFYSDLDKLGRCGYTMACISRSLMPTEDRESIGQVKPTGWHTVKYDIVDGKYLYNRCHLIGFQLTGENANEKNLITGTRYMNVDGMLPFENMVADYIKETGNHVMYRVTPIYDGNDLVAKGVLMEAYSVEDEGDGICFNVYVYNNQPGVTINYKTGESWLSTEPAPVTTTATPTITENPDGITYVLNTNTKKFHFPTCSSAEKTSEANKANSTKDRDTLISEGYSPCGVCKP